MRQPGTCTYVQNKFKTIFVAATMSMFVEYIMLLSDKVIIGNILGESALSAITLVEPFFYIVAFAAYMISGGAGILISYALGCDDKKKADQLFSQALILSLGVGIGVTLLYAATGQFLLDKIVSGTEGSAYAYEYFYYLKFLPVAQILNAVLYPIIMYQGGESYCNWSSIVVVISNIALSVLLCFSMGMGGVSLATVLGNTLGLVPLFAFFFTEKGQMKFRFYLNWKEILEIFTYSLSDAAIYLFMAAMQLVMNRFLLWKFHEESLIIFTGVLNLIFLYIALFEGVGEYLITMVSMYRGEENMAGIHKTMKLATKAALIEGAAVNLLIFVAAGIMPDIFGINVSALHTEFVTAIRICSFSACFFSLLRMYSAYYLNMGCAKLSMLITFFQILIFLLSLGIGGGFMAGLNGVWFGMVVAQILLLSVAYYIIPRKFSPLPRPTGGNILDSMLLLDPEKERRQRIWDIPMTSEAIMELVYEVEELLKSEGVSRKKINQVMLAIEETQMTELQKNKNPEKLIIECSLFMEDKITLILRNTAKCNNVILEDQKIETFQSYTSQQILGSMEYKRYILTNGNNRVKFVF